MEKLIFNYDNITSRSSILKNNLDVMQQKYNEYNNQRNNLTNSWSGDSGTVSQNSMEELIQNYNAFIDKINSFITTLDTYALPGKAEAERNSSSQYQNI